MRLPATLLGTLRLGLATGALASIGCDAVAMVPASSAGVFGTLPLVATAARADAIASQPTPAPIGERAFPLEANARAALPPVVTERSVESPVAPEVVPVAEPARKPKRARRSVPVRAVEPVPEPVGPAKGWVCGPCGMG